MSDRPSAAEKIADIIQAERWVAQAQQREFDRRLVVLAVEQELNPISALCQTAWVFTPHEIETCKEGLEL